MNHFNTTGSDPRSEQYYLDGLYLYCRPFLNQLHYFSCFTLHASLHTQIPTLPHTHQNQSHTDSTLSASLLWFGVFAHLVSTVGASDLRQLCLPEPQQLVFFLMTTWNGEWTEMSRKGCWHRSTTTSLTQSNRRIVCGRYWGNVINLTLPHRYAAPCSLWTAVFRKEKRHRTYAAFFIYSLLNKWHMLK